MRAFFETARMNLRQSFGSGFELRHWKMDWKAVFRRAGNGLLTGRRVFTLKNEMPQLERSLDGLESPGLYLHIPFCHQICPYCPYNKERFRPCTARSYAKAVIQEVDTYQRWLKDTPITSFYIGGGTPTTMLENGLEEILAHIYRSFDMRCGIHMESHPNDLTPSNLERMRSMGVEYLSIGVEALQDHHLQALHRPYTVTQVKEAVARAKRAGFRSVNADLIFALPGQTYEEVEEAGRTLVALGVDQVAAYPLFEFPYTAWSSIAKRMGYRQANIFKKRRMLSVLEEIFYAAGFRRTSVWAFTKSGVEKYCSVTVPQYVGLGASGGSYLTDVLYFNTFNVEAYIDALRTGRSPIALSMKLSSRMQMAGWLYWRIYETAFRPIDFRRRFNLDFHRVYGAYFKLFSMLGFTEENGERIVLSDRGAYWLHLLQDIFSIDYIGRLWGVSRTEPWPERVIL
jgi:coproporphyrinogen III oxidase-like Fe-S oxidoreductase